MANLEQIVSRKAENDTKWKEAQQAERENTMEPCHYHAASLSRRRDLEHHRHHQ